MATAASTAASASPTKPLWTPAKSVMASPAASKYQPSTFYAGREEVVLLLIPLLELSN